MAEVSENLGMIFSKNNMSEHLEPNFTLRQGLVHCIILKLETVTIQTLKTLMMCRLVYVGETEQQLHNRIAQNTQEQTQQWHEH